MAATTSKPVIDLPSATVRFCGDSGDGMQLAGAQLSSTSALVGNDVATFPDFPAEIRAPRGTKAGVSGFQIHFASEEIFTPGDQVDVLVAMNPAALSTNLNDLVDGGVLIVNSETFDRNGLRLAAYPNNPLEDGSLDSYQFFSVEMTKLTRLAVEGLGLGRGCPAAQARHLLPVSWQIGGFDPRHRLEKKLSASEDRCRTDRQRRRDSHARRMIPKEYPDLLDLNFFRLGEHRQL